MNIDSEPRHSPVKRPFFFPYDDDDFDPGAPDTPPPPPSKRRLIAHDDENEPVKSTEGTQPSLRAREVDTVTPGNRGDDPPKSENEDESAEPKRGTPAPAVAFDRVAFEAVIGEKLPDDILEIIGQHCGSSLESAVNIYFDGTYKKLKRAKKTTLAPRRLPGDFSTPPETPNSLPPPPPPPPRVPPTRYVGSFGVDAWSTRSGHNLLRHGDVVKIERQKVQPPLPPKTASRLGKPPPPPKGNTAAARRVDVIVRFTLGGAEMGRLSKDAADWVSTLLDQGICAFEGTVVYAPEMLRTSDTVFLQMRASLCAGAFSGRGFQLAAGGDNRPTGLFDSSESFEEKEIRLRQVALVRLLQEVNLVPSSLSAAAAKHQRQGLLQAAEMAERKDKDPQPPKGPQSKDNGGSTGDDEEGDGLVLEQDQLDALYKKAQSFDFNTPEAEPADTFAMTLRPYQRQALYWMMRKERDEKTHREPSMHPLWEEYTWPTRDADDRELPRVDGRDKFYVNPYSGDLSLDFPSQEQHCLGGILADEMGLGKTIQMLSLIHTHRSEVVQQQQRIKSEPATTVPGLRRLPRLPSPPTSSNPPAPRTTLVVAPMSLLSQWQSEAEKASREGTLRTLVYYGTEKAALNLQALCCEANAATAPDVVITSYGVVLSEFGQVAARKGDRSQHQGLFSLAFFRVILDEAHNIKNRQAKTARACYEIAADHRWLLTGTPIVNKLEDLFSLVRFLRVEPWNNFSYWRTFITMPFESKEYVRALDVVQTVLEPLVLRRTKEMKTPDGEPLVPLPPKHVEIVRVELSEKEREVYMYIFNKARTEFARNVEAGTVMKAFTTIFAQILRLRQSCCHPVLVRNRDVVADETDAHAAADASTGLADDMDLETLIQGFAAEMDAAERERQSSRAFEAHVLQQIRDEAASQCPICTEEPMVDQTVTGGCWHSACRQCLLDYMKHESDHGRAARCVSCRQPVAYRDLFEVIRHDGHYSDGGSLPTSSGSLPPSSGSGSLFKSQQEHAAPFKSQQQQKLPRISLQRVGANHSSTKISALISHLRTLRRQHPHMKSVVFSQFTSFLNLIEPALTRAGVRFLRLDGTTAQRARAAVLDAFRDEAGFAVLLISLRAGGVGLNLTSAGRVFMMDPWWSFAVEAQAIDRVHRMGQAQEVRVVRFVVKESVEERMLRVQERKKFIATSLGMMSDEEKKLQRIEDIKELLS